MTTRRGGAPGEGAPGGAPGEGAPEERRPSGLRDPGAAVRGVGAAALATMAVVQVLAVVPLVKVGVAAPALWLVGGLAAVAVVLAGVLRRRWAWWAAVVVPVGLLAGGLLHAALAVLGLLFGLLWGYVLYVRRSVAR